MLPNKMYPLKPIEPDLPTTITHIKVYQNHWFNPNTQSHSKTNYFISYINFCKSNSKL